MGEAVELGLFIIAGAIVVATILPSTGRQEWWIRALGFPRVQLLSLGIGVAAGIAFVSDLSRWGECATLAALIAAIAFQGWRLIPYTPLWPRDLPDADGNSPNAQVSILVANVLTGNRKSRGLLDTIRRLDPHIVVLLEPDSRWAADMREIEGHYPHFLKEPLDNTYGMLVYSRLPLQDPKIEYLVKDDIPSMQMDVELPGRGGFRLYCVHPEPPAPSEAMDTEDRDAELLLVANLVKVHDGPVIVCGDFNDVAWSPPTREFKDVSGLRDPRLGRGVFSTFNAKQAILRWPLDHVLVSRHFSLREIRRPPAFGSDHFPLFVSVSLTISNP